MGGPIFQFLCHPLFFIGMGSIFLILIIWLLIRWKITQNKYKATIKKQHADADNNNVQNQDVQDVQGSTFDLVNAAEEITSVRIDEGSNEVKEFEEEMLYKSFPKTEIEKINYRRLQVVQYMLIAKD